MLEKIVEIAKDASKVILKYYKKVINIEYKKDKSPLTTADLESNKIIQYQLNKYFPQIPIISEEGSLKLQKNKNSFF